MPLRSSVLRTVALVLGGCIVLGGCTISPGGRTPEPLDALSVGTLALGSPIDVAAQRALAHGTGEWRDARSGAWGTVRRTGPDDADACTPAELTVHDYAGARVEARTLCPPSRFALDPGPSPVEGPRRERLDR